MYNPFLFLFAACCSVSGPSPGAVTCLDVDVLLPMKPQDKLLPTLDALLDDKQVRACERIRTIKTFIC
jgi:hypothetical protein